MANYCNLKTNHTSALVFVHQEKVSLANTKNLTPRTHAEPVRPNPIRVTILPITHSNNKPSQYFTNMIFPAQKLETTTKYFSKTNASTKPIGSRKINSFISMKNKCLPQSACEPTRHSFQMDFFYSRSELYLHALRIYIWIAYCRQSSSFG